MVMTVDDSGYDDLVREIYGPLPNFDNEFAVDIDDVDVTVLDAPPESVKKADGDRSAEPSIESRVFCATGPGGGKDASCSPKDAGGGGGGIPAGGKDFDKDGNLVSKVVSKSSMEVGKTYKITKLGKDYQGKATAVSHSDDGKKTSITLALEGGGKKSLVLMSAAKVQEKMLAAAAQAGASASSASAWKKDVEKLVKEQEAQSKPTPGTKVGGKGSLTIPKGDEIAALPTGKPSKWKSSPDEDAKLTEAQKAVTASPSAREAIKAYTGSAYGTLNAALRKDADSKEPMSLTKAVVNIQAKLSAAQIGALSVATDIPGDKEKVVYRGGGKTLATTIASLPEDGEFMDHGFGSTSRSITVAQGFAKGDVKVILKITGKWGLPVGGVGTFGDGEKEHIMPRNMGYRLKSREWRRDEWGKPVMYAEVQGLGPRRSKYS